MTAIASRNGMNDGALRNMQKEDYAWFLEHRIELHSEYGDAFLAIKDKHVLGTYSSYAEAVKKTQKSEALGSFIVQECTNSEECFTARVASLGLNII